MSIGEIMLRKGSVLVSAVVALTSTFTMLGVAVAAPVTAAQVTTADPPAPPATEPPLTEPPVNEPPVTPPPVTEPPAPPACPPEPRPAGDCTNRDLGKPPANLPITAGSYFSYPNRTYGESVAIRNRVLNTINSTWGWYTTDPVVTPTTKWQRGTIKMTTWSFNDSTIESALRRARDRGVLVQVVAAANINSEMKYQAWSDLKTAFGDRYSSDDSFARECSGACRGAGGTAHAKYFLFDDVGSGHRRNVVVQTSMNLTRFAYQGQWNQATVMENPDVFADFASTFDLSAQRTKGDYRNLSSGSNIYNLFFPGASSSNDPIMAALNLVRCKGATAGGISGRTRIRVAQYAIYEARGTAIAKKLRSLWNAGCNVRIIYSVSSRPVLSILRSRTGRGAIPMKQSVITNRQGEIVEYNHSKWLAISGYYAGRSSGTYTVIPGSANWADLSLRSDEQMQQIFSYSWTRPYFSTFDKTWAQKTSKYPSYGRVSAGARTLNGIPEQPTFGEGIYKYLSEGG